MNSVKITFNGKNSELAASTIMTWIIDGGAEDIILDNLDFNGIKVKKMNFDMDKKEIIFEVD
jgi:hypothetical protein